MKKDWIGMMMIWISVGRVWGAIVLAKGEIGGGDMATGMGSFLIN